MKFVRIIDDNGLFVRDDFAEELTAHTIETPCPDGFYLPKWDGEKWVEGGIAPVPTGTVPTGTVPTAGERLEALEAAMLTVMGAM